MKRALVIGGLGVVGRGLLKHLLSLPDWDIVTLSRRQVSEEFPVSSISVDLLDADMAREALSSLDDVTHVYYVAYTPRPTHEEEVAPNFQMFRNVMDVLVHSAPNLQHVSLMQGTKAYGAHLGPYKTPALESDPRIISPLFYYPQQDYLAALSQGKTWSWSIMRPRCVWGFSVGSPMNMITALGVYAAISKELNLPLCFPGTMASYRRLDQAVDTNLLAKATIWASTDPAGANEIFNVANGGLFRWEHMWPRIADAVGMKCGPVRSVKLTEAMSDKRDLWEQIVTRHNLRPIPYERLVDWQFADFQWNIDYDHISDTTKLFRAGFHEMADDEQMIVDMLKQLKADLIIPE
jgi:nucleoside-diphosphate-sugar epimerase